MMGGLFLPRRPAMGSVWRGPTMERPPRRPTWIVLGRPGERGMTRLGKKHGVLQDVTSRNTGVAP